MGEVRSLGKVGLRTLLYTVIVSSIAVAISLALVNLIEPGRGIDPEAAAELLEEGAAGASSIVEASAESEAGVNQVIAVVPDNVIAVSNGIMRFEGPGRYAKDVDLDAEAISSIIKTMAAKGVYSDPTMVAFEGLYVPENGDLSPAYSPFVGTLPPQGCAARIWCAIP